VRSAPLPRAAVQIVSGQRSKRKRIKICGVTSLELREILDQQPI